MPERSTISTPNTPEAAGPYSQAVAGAGLIFVSGQLPIDGTTGKLVHGAATQATQSLHNIEAILAARGVDIDAIVKCTVFLTDMTSFADVNDAYVAFFPDDPPARSAFAVAALPKGAEVEIEAIALDAAS